MSSTAVGWQTSTRKGRVLPAKLPNLLLNGAEGIAVGMATKIPPHNLAELCAASVLLLEDPGASVADLLRVLPGPDFPTGGILLGKRGIQEAYATGRGGFRDDRESLPVAGCPGPVGIVFNFYALPQAGQKRRYGVAGHSFVGVVELAEQPRAKTILQFGQSGDPASPHWFDQAKLYAKGEFKASWYEKTDVEANSTRPYHPGDTVRAAR